MSRVRTNSPIDDVDRIAQEEGFELSQEGDVRTFGAFNRLFRIEEAPSGKVGIFRIESRPEDPDEPGYHGMETHATLRRLFQRSIVWREARA